MRTLDDVIHWVSKAAALPDADLDKDILHYLMMYRWLLRQQAGAENAVSGMKKQDSGAGFYMVREDSSPRTSGEPSPR